MKKYDVNVTVTLPVLTKQGGHAGHQEACRLLRDHFEKVGATSICFGGSVGTDAEPGQVDTLGKVAPAPRLFKLYYTATVGAVYIRASDIDEAMDKLNHATNGPRFIDQQDVRFDMWVDVSEHGVHDVSADDVEEISEDAAAGIFDKEV